MLAFYFLLCLHQIFIACIIYSYQWQLQFAAFYKEIKWILSRIEFSLLVRPSTTVPVLHEAPWENELPTPALQPFSGHNFNLRNTYLQYLQNY